MSRRSPQLIYQWVSNGKLPSIRIGRRIYIDKRYLDALTEPKRSFAQQLSADDVLAGVEPLTPRQLAMVSRAFCLAVDVLNEQVLGPRSGTGAST